MLQIEVVYCAGPGLSDHVPLALPAGATLADAVRLSGLVQRHGLEPQAAVQAGIWCKVQPPDTVLRDRDRVEIYRALQVDPKEARRLRHRRDSLARKR